jgi:hypothetical protein
VLGAVRTVVVPLETIREVVWPLRFWLTLEVVVPDTFELTVAVVLAGLFTVRLELLLPLPRFVETARAPDCELASD